MKFNYAKPSTSDELSKLLNEGGIIFSGGTDIFVKIRAGVISPNLLIDSKYIQNRNMEFKDGILTIYMNNTYSDLLENEDIKEKYPLLINVVSSIGSTQIRNKGTMIGNVANASPAGDFLLSSYIYDAKVIIKPSNKEIKISNFVRGPGRVDLEKGEYIDSIKFPYLENYKFYYEKLGRRNEMVISIASIGVAIKLDNNIIKDIRIAYGSVGPTIVRILEFEKEFVGKKFELSLFEKMAEKYKSSIKPISDVRGSAEYRKKMVKNLLIKSYYKLAGDYK
jgi:xanthine dehydrogenase FAD-binding subunit